MAEQIVVPEMTPFLIGREEECDLELNDPQVSRRHAQIEVQPDGRVVVRDLGSANGTFVDADRLSGGAWLALPGTITLGRTSIVVELADQAGASGLIPIDPPKQAARFADQEHKVDLVVRDTARWLRLSGAFLVGSGLLAFVIALASRDRPGEGLTPILVGGGIINLALGIAELTLAGRLGRPDYGAWKAAVAIVGVVIATATISLLSALVAGVPTLPWSQSLSLVFASGAAGYLYRSRNWHRSA